MIEVSTLYWVLTSFLLLDFFPLLTFCSSPFFSKKNSPPLLPGRMTAKLPFKNIVRFKNIVNLFEKILARTNVFMQIGLVRRARIELKEKEKTEFSSWFLFNGDFLCTFCFDRSAVKKDTFYTPSPHFFFNLILRNWRFVFEFFPIIAVTSCGIQS